MRQEKESELGTGIDSLDFDIFSSKIYISSCAFPFWIVPAFFLHVWTQLAKAIKNTYYPQQINITGNKSKALFLDGLSA